MNGAEADRRPGSSARASDAALLADPLRGLRRRVLLLSAPLVFIFAITDRLVLRGAAFWAAFAVRIAWGATLVGTALSLHRLGAAAERRLLVAVGFTTPLFFAVLALMTGGMKSPLFHFIVAMPLVVAVVLQDQPGATLAAAIAMVASGVAIVGREARASSAVAQWLVQAAAMGALAVYASIAYRRLRLYLDAAVRAELTASERARLFETELAARDEFLAVASHELKTPMTSLLLQVETLGRLRGDAAVAGSAPTARLASRYASIARQTWRLAALVDSLLDASRIQAGRLEIVPADVELVSVVASCLLSFEEDVQRVGSRIALCVGRTMVDLTAGDPNGAAGDRIVGRWDPRRLEQIVGNLVANAIRYGAGSPIEVRLAATDEQVTIAVRDGGIGIAAADQRRIFERFEQVSTEKAAGGLGLGLWITQQLVEAMGGRILVTSAPGDGSTFTIELPRQTGVTSVAIDRSGRMKSAS